MAPSAVATWSFAIGSRWYRSGLNGGRRDAQTAQLLSERQGKSGRASSFAHRRQYVSPHARCAPLAQDAKRDPTEPLVAFAVAAQHDCTKRRKTEDTLQLSCRPNPGVDQIEPGWHTDGEDQPYEKKHGEDYSP